MKSIYFLITVLAFSLLGIGSANAQIALEYSDTTTCPGQTIQMCAALTGQASPLNSDDQFTGVLDIGFPFVFFGKTYTRCIVSGNGMISFDTTSAGNFAGWMWSQISTGTPTQANNSIFVTFLDLYLPAGGKIRYQHFGPVGHRRFIVEWCHLPLFGCNSQIVTSQAILYEGSNVIEVHTTDIPPINAGCPAASSGYFQQVIQGVRNDLGTIAFYPPNRDPASIATSWGVAGVSHDGMRFTPNGSTSYMMNAIPFNAWVIIDSLSSVDLKWFAEGQPNLPIATGACVSPTINANINYYTVSYNGNAGCELDSVAFIDTVHIHFGTVHVTNQAEVCAGSTYTWFGRTLFAAGNYDTLLHTGLGCDSFITLQLAVNPLPDVSIKGSPNVSICEGSSTILALLNPQTNVTYQWSKDDAPISGETGATITVSQAGKYKAVATTNKGCQATSQPFTLTVNPIPVAKIEPLSNDIICAYDTLQLIAGIGENYDYRWSPEKPFRIVTGAEGQKVKGVFIDPTTQVVLTVFNQYGCYDSDTAKVATKPCCEVSIPNAFSPNGDGVNDFFLPLLQPGQIVLNLRIYDRNGKMVYNNETVKTGWNGTYENGAEAASGVYMYYMKYTCADGKLYEKKESVTLIR
jgi:gliding motility-associated-like protein